MVYSWPEALEKARAADAIVRERLRGLGLEFDELHTEFFGVNACLGPVAPAVPEPAEVQLRIGVRGPDKRAVDRFYPGADSAGAEWPSGCDGIWRGTAAGS